MSRRNRHRRRRSRRTAPSSKTAQHRECLPDLCRDHNEHLMPSPVLPRKSSVDHNSNPQAKRERALDAHYDLCINLEDTLDVAQFLKTVRCGEIFGAYVDSDGSLRYTANSERWFDLSLISAYGKMRADGLKFQNRQTYQELVFEGLGFRFAGETYLLPEPIETGLSGDVAIAADAGPIWPM